MWSKPKYESLEVNIIHKWKHLKAKRQLRIKNKGCKICCKQNILGLYFPMDNCTRRIISKRSKELTRISAFLSAPSNLMCTFCIAVILASFSTYASRTSGWCKAENQVLSLEMNHQKSSFAYEFAKNICSWPSKIYSLWGFLEGFWKFKWK